MASAIIKGLLASGISPGRISASDPWEPARAKAKALGLNVTGNAEVAIVSEIIVVAVKPDVVASALAPLELRGKLVVSIAAGVPLMAIEIAAGNGARCVRTMPNTPCLVGEAAVGVELQHAPIIEVTYATGSKGSIHYTPVAPHSQ